MQFKLADTLYSFLGETLSKDVDLERASETARLMAIREAGITKEAVYVSPERLKRSRHYEQLSWSPNRGRLEQYYKENEDSIYEAVDEILKHPDSAKLHYTLSSQVCGFVFIVISY